MSKNKYNLAIFAKKVRENKISEFYKNKIFAINQLNNAHSNEIYQKANIGKRTIAGQEVACKLIDDRFIRGQEIRKNNILRFFEVDEKFNVNKASNC